MELVVKLRDRLVEPRLNGIDVDSSELIDVHRQILMEKPMLRRVFVEFYQTCRDIDAKFFSGEGHRVELGAGVSLFKKYFPDIITSDIKPAPHLDRVIDALDMDFEDDSVRALYGMNCFHHFPDPQKFFNELKRVLVPGGGCVLVEPYYGAVANRFYQRLHKTEHFNKSQESWKTSDSMGVMNNANQALSYVVLKRDRKKFEELNPELEIVYEKPFSNYLRYLVSGGLNFRPLVPNALEPVVRFVEWALKPVESITALHYAVVIRKRQS